MLDELTMRTLFSEEVDLLVVGGSWETHFNSMLFGDGDGGKKISKSVGVKFQCFYCMLQCNACPKMSIIKLMIRGGNFSLNYGWGELRLKI